MGDTTTTSSSSPFSASGAATIALESDSGGISSVLPLEPMPTGEPPRPWLRMSMFWRTFILLVLLLAATAGGLFHILLTQELEPHVAEGARQMASLVNLSRAALVYADAIERISLIKELGEQEQVHILPREAGDRYTPFTRNSIERAISHGLAANLGESTILACSVNDKPGLWIGFDIQGDPYWLLMERSRAAIVQRSSTWLRWMTLIGVLSLIGAAAISLLLNRPLRQLAAAAASVREGKYAALRLNEATVTNEVRDVNIAFNRMASQLAKAEQDRAQMLAGISHDLRTPLARLRLEIEMSVPEEDARVHMSDDISQVDTIIGKFLDYARPGNRTLHSMQLARLVRTGAAPFLVRDDILVRINVDPALYVLCDEVEFARVIANLLENARRYGKTPGENRARVRIAATAREGWVTLRVHDHGPGVPDSILSQLTRPFFRADGARTAAAGSGLGLAIVSRIVESMEGRLHVINAPSGGLMVIVQLRQASSPPATGPSGL